MIEMKPRVLIIDDDPSLARMLALTLKQTGLYETRDENHAMNALATARQFKPDLVVLDVMMPEMDGGDVLAQLRADAATKHTPVIFMTALVGSEEAPMGGMDSGGNRFLPKPVSCVELTQCIESILGEQQVPPK